MKTGLSGKRKPETASRARAKAERATAAEAHRRTMQVAREMSKGEWRTERAAELAAEWEVSESAVRQVSAAASKVVRLLAGETDELRDNLMRWLERAYAMALEQKDPKAMVAAALGAAKLLGLDAPQKVAITDVKGNDVVRLPLVLQDAHPAVIKWAIENNSVPTEERAKRIREEADASKVVLN